MTDPFVSVVTPVYNDEPYLEECIRTSCRVATTLRVHHLQQSQQDRSGEIAADYASMDSRIRVVSPPNSHRSQELQLRSTRDLRSIELLQDAALR